MTKKSLSTAWFPRDLGVSYWVINMFRCKMFLGNVEVIFMEEAPWTVMTCCISRNRWKLRRMQNVFCVALKNVRFKHLRAVANSSPALLPLPLRVEPKPKSGIRQQDLLKRVVEVKSKKSKVPNSSNGNNSPVIPSTQAMPSGKSGADNKEIETLPVRSSEAGDRKIDNPVKILLSVYDSSDDDDD
ncbi:uncharacterized protein [Solanum lycopersicum]|uniref:uncharacterized protein isoform X2 n=1 Tax=Solanum lycopersicum TaxID=4081 RepID=UPI00374A91BC